MGIFSRFRVFTDPVSGQPDIRICGWKPDTEKTDIQRAGYPVQPFLRCLNKLPLSVRMDQSATLPWACHTLRRFRSEFGVLNTLLLRFIPFIFIINIKCNGSVHLKFIEYWIFIVNYYIILEVNFSMASFVFYLKAFFSTKSCSRNQIKIIINT